MNLPDKMYLKERQMPCSGVDNCSGPGVRNGSPNVLSISAKCLLSSSRVWFSFKAEQRLHTLKSSPLQAVLWSLSQHTLANSGYCFGKLGSCSLSRSVILPRWFQSMISTSFLRCLPSFFLPIFSKTGGVGTNSDLKIWSELIEIVVEVCAPYIYISVDPHLMESPTLTAVINICWLPHIAACYWFALWMIVKTY